MKMPVHSGMRAKVLTRGYPPCQLFLKPTVHRAIAQGFPPQFLPVSIIALWANCGGHCLGCPAAEVPSPRAVLPKQPGLSPLPNS